MSRLVIAACLAALALPALAQTQKSTPEAQPKAPPAKAVTDESKNDPTKLICTYVRPVGSRLRVRQCRTQEQVEQDKQNADRIAEKTRGMQQQQIVVPTN